MTKNNKNLIETPINLEVNLENNYLWRGTKKQEGRYIHSTISLDPMDKLELGVDVYAPITDSSKGIDLNFFVKYELSDDLNLTLGINDLDSDIETELGVEFEVKKISGQFNYNFDTEALYLSAETNLGVDTKIYTGYLIDVRPEDNKYFSDTATTSGFTELGFEITKEIKMTEIKNLPITGKLVYNPTDDKTYYGVSVRLL